MHRATGSAPTTPPVRFRYQLGEGMHVDQVRAEQGLEGQSGGTTLGEYAGAFRRRWWVIALGAVLGLGLASVYLLIAPKTYLSTATVIVEPMGGSLDNSVDGGRTNSGVNLDTEAQLVKSQAVSAEAKVRLQTTEIVGQLVQHVAVDVPPNTNVLRITFAASTPEDARDGAAAYADAYLTNRRETAADLRQDISRGLDQEAARLTTDLKTASPDEAETIRTSLQTLATARASLENASTTPGKVISEALLPRRPSAPNSALILTSGLAFGLLLGLAGLYLLERRDGRCYDWRSVERRLGLAILADIPGKEGSPAPLFEPHSSGAEAFGQVRNAILTGMGDEPATLVIASPTEGFGADVVSANLAVTLARSGRSTTLLIADESSQIPVMFGLPATDGLTEVLRGRVELNSAMQNLPDVPALKIIPAGHGLQSEVSDLEGSGVADVLESVAERTHFVIIRARPNDVAADAQFFGRFAQAAIPVIEIGRTLRDAVTDGVRQWRLIDTPVPGAVSVPAFDAPEPAPPRAVTTGAVDEDPAPRPALGLRGGDEPSTKAPPASAASGGVGWGSTKPAPSTGQSTPRSSANGGPRDGERTANEKSDEPTHGDGPLRKAPPQR